MWFLAAVLVVGLGLVVIQFMRQMFSLDISAVTVESR